MAYYKTNAVFEKKLDEWEVVGKVGNSRNGGGDWGDSGNIGAICILCQGFA